MCLVSCPEKDMGKDPIYVVAHPKIHDPHYFSPLTGSIWLCGLSAIHLRIQQMGVKFTYVWQQRAVEKGKNGDVNSIQYRFIVHKLPFTHMTQIQFACNKLFACTHTDWSQNICLHMHMVELMALMDMGTYIWALITSLQGFHHLLLRQN